MILLRMLVTVIKRAKTRKFFVESVFCDVYSLKYGLITYICGFFNMVKP